MARQKRRDRSPLSSSFKAAKSNQRPSKTSSTEASTGKANLTSLPPELLHIVLQNLSRHSINDLINTHSHFEDQAGRLLWKDLSLRLGKFPFPKQMMENWREKGLWKSTETLRIYCPSAPLAQDTLQDLLFSIPPNKISILSFATHSRLNRSSMRALGRFLTDNPSIEKIALPSITDKDEIYQDGNPHPWLENYLAFRLCLQQPGHHSRLSEIIAVDGDILELPSQLMHRRAVVSSVDVWGYDNAREQHPNCNFWSHIASISAGNDILKHVTSIYLAGLQLGGPLYDHTHLHKLTDIANLAHLHLQDCANVNEFLAGLSPLLHNLKRFVLRMDSHDNFNCDSVYTFIMERDGLEELGMQFPLQGTLAKDPTLLLSNHSQTLTKLVIQHHMRHSLEQYLKDIVKTCTSLTHFGFLLNERHNPYYKGEYDARWESNMIDLADILKNAPTITHLNINFPVDTGPNARKPVRVPGKDKDRHRITAQRKAEIFYERGFKPTQLSLCLLRTKYKASEALPKSSVFDIVEPGGKIEAVLNAEAEDWTKFGGERLVRERMDKSMGAF